MGGTVYERHDGCVASFTQAKRTIARRVRARRSELGLSQEDVAGAADMDVRHIQKIEAGEVNLTLQTLCKVAKALRLSVAELLS